MQTMPAPPSPHTVVAIALVLVAIYLFTREARELESSSLFVLIAVVIWFELFVIEFEGARVRAGDFLAGFGNEALITVCALLIL
ncbi:MAG: SLC13 family permease, partial [Bacteroidota bacterium]